MYKIMLIALLSAVSLIEAPAQHHLPKHFHPSEQRQESATYRGTAIFDNGEPAAFVLVAVKHTQQSTYTDEQGKFCLQGVKTGKQTLVFRSMETEDTEVEVYVGKHSKLGKFRLNRGTHHLDEVKVTADTKKRKVETSGFAANVLDMQKLSLQPAEVMELLDKTPGVRIRQDGGLGSNAKINLNGLSGHAIQVFVNGVPASNYGGAFSLSNIPTSLIERIEVYKGVVPAHLAGDALGGAINVILKEKASNYLSTSYTIGSFNTHQWNAVGSYRNGNSGLTVSGSLFFNHSDNDYKVWGPSVVKRSADGRGEEIKGGAKRFHDAYRNYGVRATIGFTNVVWADKATLGIVYSQGYKEIQNAQTMWKVYGNRHQHTRLAMAEAEYDKRNFLLKNLDVQFKASYSLDVRNLVDTVGIQYDWSGTPILDAMGQPIRFLNGAEVPKRFIISGTGPTDGDERNHSLSLRTNVGYTFHPQHSVHLNVAWNDYWRSSTDRRADALENALNNTRRLGKLLTSVNYQMLMLRDRLRWNVFYKHFMQSLQLNTPTYISGNAPENYVIDQIVDRNTRTDHGYGTALSFKLTPWLTLMGSAERSLRQPNATEVFGNEAGGITPSHQLRPEVSNNLNVGISLYNVRWREHNLVFNGSYFVRDTRDMIRQTVTPSNSDYSSYENLESVFCHGFDAELKYTYQQRLQVNLVASRFVALFNTKKDKLRHDYLYYGTQIRNEPSFKGTADVSYTWSLPRPRQTTLSLNSGVQYVNQFRRDWANVGGRNIDIIPAQYPVHLGLTLGMINNKVVVALTAKNIMNQQIFDNFGLQKPGRSVMAKVTWNIF